MGSIYFASLNKLNVCVYVCVCVSVCEEESLVQTGVSCKYYLGFLKFPGTAVGSHPLFYFVLPGSTSSHR